MRPGLVFLTRPGRGRGRGVEVPAASIARTSNECLPGLSFLYFCGDLHGLNALWSRLQAKVEPASVDLKVSFAVVLSSLLRALRDLRVRQGDVGAAVRQRSGRAGQASAPSPTPSPSLLVERGSSRSRPRARPRARRRPGRGRRGRRPRRRRGRPGRRWRPPGSCRPRRGARHRRCPARRRRGRRPRLGRRRSGRPGSPWCPPEVDRVQAGDAADRQRGVGLPVRRDVEARVAAGGPASRPAGRDR